MVMATRSLPHASTKYWVDVILTTAWDRRFDCEREALAYAQVYARLPNACAVVAYAYTHGSVRFAAVGVTSLIAKFPFHSVGAAGRVFGFCYLSGHSPRCVIKRCTTPEASACAKSSALCARKSLVCVSGDCAGA
jgi:hypothetical protein